jgi:endonuclease-3
MTHRELRAKVRAVHDALEAHFGVPVWSRRADPLTSLIVTILSQNTNDVNRDRAYSSLRARFRTWEDVLAAEPEAVAEAIRVGGLSGQKSVRIKRVLEWVGDTYGALSLDAICEMPTDEVFELLGALPGVGTKTISVVLSFACGRDVFPVDTHIHRIARRLGFVPTSASAEKTHRTMAVLVPQGKAYSFHINLLRFGRSICKAGRPRCGECFIFKHCQYHPTIRPDSATGGP